MFAKGTFAFVDRLQQSFDPWPASLSDTFGCDCPYQEWPFGRTKEESGRLDEGCTCTTQNGQDEEEQHKTRPQWERRL
jgi:hypothetical protein